MKRILLTFDAEEFDLPRDFGKNISDEEAYKVGLEGLKEILKILDVKATFFFSAKFAEANKEFVKEIGKKHEIGLHCLEHKDRYNELSSEESFKKLKKGKEIIEKIIGKEVKGFRAPRFFPPSDKVLEDLGFEYDSSLHPSFIPGRYNKLFSARKVHMKTGLKEIPVSVYPFVRFPMTWVFFRNFPLIYSKIGTLLNKNMVVVVHPWDFVSLDKYDIPYLIRRNSGNKMKSKFSKYIKWCKSKNYQFKTMGEI